jgi:hypothetical protein
MQKLNGVQIRAGQGRRLLPQSIPCHLAKASTPLLHAYRFILLYLTELSIKETGTGKRLSKLTFKRFLVKSSSSLLKHQSLKCLKKKKSHVSGHPMRACGGFPRSCALHVQLAVAHAYLRGVLCWLHVSCMYHQTE